MRGNEIQIVFRNFKSGLVKVAGSSQRADAAGEAGGGIALEREENMGCMLFEQPRSELKIKM